MSRTEEIQRTFRALLARPLVTAESDPALYRDLTVHQAGVRDRARRLGYRLQRAGRAVRLTRVPLAGTVAHPPPPKDPPSRRTLTLVCLLAAACEDVDHTATLQRLSEIVAELAATTDRVGDYDADQLSHRRQLVKAAAVLEHWGVLTRRVATDRVEEWTETRSGIGAGFEVDRDALLLLTAPDVLAAALNPTPPDPAQSAATRTQRMLRQIVETPAVHYADLEPDDATALRGVRGLRIADVRAITGADVESRSEGLLVVNDDPACPTTMNWPTPATGSWVALLAADAAGRAGTRHPNGTVTLEPAVVDDLIDDLMSWRGHLFNQTLRDNPAATRTEAERWLVHLGLLRLHPDPSTGDRSGWTLLPVAARYRDPDVVLPDRDEPPAPQLDLDTPDHPTWEPTR